MFSLQRIITSTACASQRTLPMFMNIAGMSTKAVEQKLRVLRTLDDLHMEGLQEILNTSKALQNTMRLHRPSGSKPVVPLETRPFEGLHIGIVLQTAPSEDVKELNIIKVLEMCGATVKLTCVTELARKQRQALKKAGTPIDKDTPTARLAADYIRSLRVEEVDNKAEEAFTDATTLKKRKTRRVAPPVPFDLLLGVLPAARCDATVDALATHAQTPFIALMTSFSSPLNALGLLQAGHTAASGLQGRKLGFVGSGRHPLALDLMRAAQMLQFGMTVSAPRRLLPGRALVDSIVDREYKTALGDTLPSSVFEAVEHPFIAVAQADLVVTDTVVPHVTPQGKPSHPLSATLGQYEVDREMLSVAKDTVCLAHVTNPHRWEAPPLGADDPRCLWATQLGQENFALVSLCAWALRMPLQ